MLVICTTSIAKLSTVSNAKFVANLLDVWIASTAICKFIPEKTKLNAQNATKSLLGTIFSRRTSKQEPALLLKRKKQNFTVQFLNVSGPV